ncbi:MAG: glycoside hydrolase family 2 TIM barrel-domain containing protein [Bacteroidota bacterium]
MTRKPHIFPRIFSLFLPLVSALFLITPVFAQQRILENGQPTLRGQDAGIYPDTPLREKIDLAGTWTFSTDKETWSELKVPSSLDFEGKVTFRRKFTMDESLLQSHVFRLVAFGINYECEVFVNDVFIGKHVGGYTTTEFDIPDEALQLGPENSIQIVVDNRLNGRSTLPLRKQVWGWRNYGGILRDVYILVTPRLWISELHALPTVSTDLKVGTIRVSAVISNRGFQGLKKDSSDNRPVNVSYMVGLELVDKMSQAVVAQSLPVALSLERNKEHNVETSLTMNEPRLWSPETPELYFLRATIFSVEGKQKLAIDEMDRLIGFSHVVVGAKSFEVNGVAATLKGIVWHEDHPGVGASLTYEQMDKDVVLMKSLGANAVRFAFHPPHPYMIDLCARYGLFALEEVPVWNAPVDILSDESFQSLTDTYLREMIERDLENPAVLAWGIGDQFDSADERAAAFVRQAAAVARSLDARPVYFGSRMVYNDVCAKEVDFAAINLPSADLKNFRRLLSEWKKDHANQPVIVLSYGKEVDQNNRNGYSDPLSQEAQARFFFQQYGAIRDLKIAGSFVSSFADWRGDRPIMNVNIEDHYVHPVGLMSYDRAKRLSYEMVRALYSEEKINAIPIGTYRSSFPVAHVLSGLFVIILVGYQYTYNRRFGEAIKRAFLRSYNFFADLRDHHSVSMFQTLLLALSISITLAVVLSSILYHYRADRFADYVLTYFIVWDSLKEQFIRATWHPLAGIMAFTGCFFVGFGLLAMLVKVCSVFIRKKISWYHSYTVSVWGAMPLIFLSPVAMSLFKVMENPLYIIPSLVLIFVFLLWAFSRILKGVSVIYDLSSAKVYVGGVLVSAVLLGALFFYYDSTYALGSYFSLVVNVARSLG